MPSFIPATGSTLRVVGVWINRIGKERFKEPNLFGRLLSRVAVDNIVVDHESVTRSFPDGPGTVEVIAIYEVVEGKIVNAWFKQGQPVLDT